MGSSVPDTAAGEHRPTTLTGALFRRSDFVGETSTVQFESADGTCVSALLQTPAAPPRAWLVYLHGGGWANGSSREYQHLTATLAHALRVTVMSVDYRLSPQHTYPAALNDALGALRFASSCIAASASQTSRTLVCMGDSAGAALATVASRRHNLAHRDVPVSLQVLAYPVCDDDFDRPSYRTFGTGQALTTELMRQFWHQYCPDPALRGDGDCAPMRAIDLAGSPPAVVATAGLDPLQDEGKAYAGKLRAAGVEVQAFHFDQLPHSFMAMAQQSPEAHGAMQALLGELDRRLG